MSKNVHSIGGKISANRVSRDSRRKLNINNYTTKVENIIAEEDEPISPMKRGDSDVVQTDKEDNCDRASLNNGYHKKLRKSMSHRKEVDSPMGTNELSDRRSRQPSKRVPTRQKISSKMASLKVSNHLNFNLNFLESERGESPPKFKGDNKKGVNLKFPVKTMN